MAHSRKELGKKHGRFFESDNGVRFSGGEDERLAGAKFSGGVAR